ncbi:MAG: SAM-dependent chlorinase/fluorinase [Bacteroidales bacterium]|nr:SAM-dependent chlorinase/fluorinase [Bacteroidales bacterium]
MSRPIITLTADWGSRDFFAGMVKGRIFSQLPDANVVDIALGLEPYNIVQAVFVVRSACTTFPEGTIHIIDVNSEETIDQSFVAIEYRGQYFICTDNGLPYAVFGNDFTRAVQLHVFQDSDYFTFAAYNLFCKVAVMIAQGEPFDSLGVAVDTLNRRQVPTYVDDGSRLSVYVTYADSYGNIYLSLTHSEFEALRRGRRFHLVVREYTVTELSPGYDEVRQTSRNSVRLLLTVSATGYLELALKEASATKLIGVRPGDTVLIYFDD